MRSNASNTIEGVEQRFEACIKFFPVCTMARAREILRPRVRACFASTAGAGLLRPQNLTNHVELAGPQSVKLGGSSDWSTSRSQAPPIPSAAGRLKDHHTMGVRDAHDSCHTRQADYLRESTGYWAAGFNAVFRRP
jgi:hypothetical protein